MHGPPAVRRDLLGRGGELAPRIVDEKVDGAEALDRRLDERLHLVDLAHVRGNGQAGASEGLDRRPDGGEGLRSTSADDDRRSRAGELEGRGRADAGTPSGDERDPPVVGGGRQHRAECRRRGGR